MPPKKKKTTHAVRRTTAVAAVAPTTRTRAQAAAVSAAAPSGAGATQVPMAATARRPATRSSAGGTAPEPQDVTPLVRSSPQKAKVPARALTPVDSARVNQGASLSAQDAAKAAERFKRAQDHIAQLVAAAPIDDSAAAPLPSPAPKQHRADPLTTPGETQRTKAVPGPSIPPPSPLPTAQPDSGGKGGGASLHGLSLFGPQDVTHACLMCRGLLVVVRTHLAQFKDVDGLLARKRGLVCDPRVMSSAASVVSHSFTAGLVGHLGALFPDIVAVSWVRSSTQLALVMPRVHMLCTEIPTAAQMEVDLYRRFPGGVAEMQAAAAGVRIPRFAERAGSTTAAGASLGRDVSESLPSRFAEAAAPDVVIPADLDGFLSEGRAAAIRQAIAFKRFAKEKRVVAKAAELSALETVLAAYDRLRAHFVRGLNSLGTQRAATMLGHLNCDPRPVDPAIARRRLELLLSFAGSCGMSLNAGTLDDGVIVFNSATASRSALASAVTEAGNQLELQPVGPTS